jgi:hypothetical protein
MGDRLWAIELKSRRTEVEKFSDKNGTMKKITQVGK